MNISQLNYFIELIQEGSFSAAAQKLGITQPALSLQIKSLEDELEFRLIDRTRKPFELTPEGEVVLEKAREIVKMTEHLKDVSMELSMADKGLLRIGIIPTVAPYLVPLFINYMSERYPQIRIEITELLTEEIISALKDGKLDAGILSTPIEAKSIVFKPLFYEKFYLYISDKHDLFEHEKISLKDFNPDQLWYLQEGNCFQNQVTDFCHLANKQPAGQPFFYRSNSIESLRRIVESRGGMTFIPELATINVPSEYEDLVKPIAEPVPFREISLAVNRIHSRERLLNRLIESIRASLPPRMLEKPNGQATQTGIRI